MSVIVNNTVISNADMELQLSDMLGRKVDLRTPQDLSKYFRNKVIEEAEVLYERK
jgi:predicted nucleotidyltransferase